MRVPPAERQAQAFRSTRATRRSAVGEDYLKLISDLEDSSGGAVRAVDLVQRLGVAQPTVTKMLTRVCTEN